MLVVCVTITWLIISPQDNKKEVISTAKQFIQHLCNKEIEQARALSIGKVNNALASRVTDPVLAATLTRLDTKISAYSDKSAVVNVAVDTQQTDGSYDTTWYRMFLLKEQGSWKVARVEPCGFMTGAIGGRTGRLDLVPVDELGAVFTRYVEMMAAGNWDKAGEYLVGPAKTAQIASRTILEKGQIIQAISSLDIQPVWANKNDIITRATYKMGERDARVVIHFHLTDGGWKIAEIDNVVGGGE